MENQLTSVELMFAIKLKVFIDNSADISSFPKLAVLSGYSEPGAKLLCYKLQKKNVISLETIKGRHGSCTIKLLVDPYSLLTA